MSLTTTSLTVQVNLTDTDLSGADLSGSILSDAGLSRADLNGADLNSANLRDATLSGAILEGANLRFTNLRSANLNYASLDGAHLRGAVFTDVDLTASVGINLKGVDPDQITPPEGYKLVKEETKLLEVKLPDRDEHLAIYYRGEIANTYLWDDSTDQVGRANPLEVVTDHTLD